ncbi:MAG: hypothetical protein EGQ81_02685 [Akkermansia sp.]|nr:hypothetical protein [Akkermansia sp.]
MFHEDCLFAENWDWNGSARSGGFTLRNCQPENSRVSLPSRPFPFHNGIFSSMQNVFCGEKLFSVHVSGGKEHMPLRPCRNQ